jgi:hypothetical protein
MGNNDTGKAGIKLAVQQLDLLGAVNIATKKVGNKNFITFMSPNGNHYK